ncbi:MAG: O-antigen ligase family protein [Candidatus Omnitrophica bacterium]|nr:O-antigen ligase family protein [Candidatus Omnitrophota bacterium]
MQDENLFIKSCDRVMIFAVYLTAFFLPIAPAVIEVAFVLMLLPFLVKRVFIAFLKLRGLSGGKGFEFTKDIFLIVSGILKPVPGHLNKFIGLYILVVFISILSGQYFSVGLKGFVFKLLQGAYTFFIIQEVITNRRKFFLMILILVASSFVVASNGIYQYLVRSDFIRMFNVYDGRVTSTFKHSNDLGGYLVTIIPFLLGATISFFRGKKELKLGIKLDQLVSRIINSKWFRVFLVFLLLSAITIWGLTYSRGAWIALVGAYSFILFRKPKVFALFIVIVTLFGALFIPKLLKERITNVTNDGLLDSSSRFIYWKSALAIIKDKPVLGTGFNSYSLSAKNYDIIWKGYPHNIYLHIAAETGLLGLAAFLAFLFSVFKIGRAAVSDELFFFLQSGFLTGFIALAIHCFFDTGITSQQLDALLWIIASCIVLIPKLSAKDNFS